MNSAERQIAKSFGARAPTLTREQCENRQWPHNQRCRFTHGFLCEECDTWFPLAHPDYAKYEGRK